MKTLMHHVSILSIIYMDHLMSLWDELPFRASLKQVSRGAFRWQEAVQAWACRVLGLRGKQLSLPELRAAYRRKALLVHPDKTKAHSQDFHELSAAYEALLEPFQSLRRDEKRKSGPKGHWSTCATCWRAKAR